VGAVPCLALPASVPPGVLPICHQSPAWGRAARQPPGLPLAPCCAFSNNKILVELDESSGTAGGTSAVSPSTHWTVWGTGRAPSVPAPRHLWPWAWETTRAPDVPPSAAQDPQKCLGVGVSPVMGTSGGWVLLGGLRQTPAVTVGRSCDPSPAHASSPLWGPCFGDLVEWQVLLRGAALWDLCVLTARSSCHRSTSPHQTKGAPS